MLNYVAAEFYKLRFKKSLFVGTALLLLLESLIVSPAFWVDEAGRLLDAYLGFLEIVLFLGVFIAPIFAIAVFDDQHGKGTLKNEIVYGIPRSRIYLGKLLAGMLAGTACALAAVGWYLLLSLLATGTVESEMWPSLAKALVIAWLVWLAVLSFTFFLLMTLKGAAGAIACVYLVTFFGLPTALSGGAEASSPTWFRVACRLFYTYPLGGELIFGEMPTWVPAWPVLYALLVSALWIVMTTGLGLALFQRREIK